MLAVGWHQEGSCCSEALVLGEEGTEALTCHSRGSLRWLYLKQLPAQVVIFPQFCSTLPCLQGSLELLFWSV